MPDGGDKPVRNSSDRLRDAVRDVVQREMVAAAMTLRDLPELRAHPIPADLDAEGELLCALLNDHCTPAELAPLQPKHFFSRFNSRVAVCLWTNDARDVEALTDALASVGTLGPVTAELVMLRDSIPLGCRPALARQARLLVELWERRRIIDAMRRLELELSSAIVSAAQARARLGVL